MFWSTLLVLLTITAAEPGCEGEQCAVHGGSAAGTVMLQVKSAKSVANYADLQGEDEEADLEAETDEDIEEENLDAVETDEEESSEEETGGGKPRSRRRGGSRRRRRSTPICREEVVLDFTSKLKHSNLGGQGPDKDKPEEIRFGNVATIKGKSIDMIMISLGVYKSPMPKYNGAYGGFGFLTLSKDSGVDLKMSFVDAMTDEPVVVSQFYFSVFDLDTGDSEDASKEVERISSKRFSKYYRGSNTLVKKKREAKGWTSFTATRYGKNDEDPKEPLDLSKIQKRQTVSFLFTDKSTFYLSYEISPGNKIIGHDLYFAGRSGILKEGSDACIPQCGGEVMLDFEKATVKHNNLGGLGPDKDEPKEIRYGSIGKNNGKSIDMIVSTSGEYRTPMPKLNGIRGKFGLLALSNGTKTPLKIRFVDSDTDKPATLLKFYLSFLDIDHSTNKEHKQKEKVYAKGFREYFRSKKTAIKRKGEGKGWTSFTAMKSGDSKDNPSDPLKLDTEQKRRVVSFMYLSKSEIDVIFEVAEGKGRGREFFFAGKSAVVTKECITPNRRRRAR